MLNAETQARAQAVYDYLIMNPEKHNQGDWAQTDGDTPRVEDFEAEENMCGTTMCVAGTAMFLFETDKFVENIFVMDSGRTPHDWVHTGGNILGLDFDQAFRLFYTMDDETALDMLNAAAQGDAEKFMNLHVNRPDPLLTSGR